MKPGAKNKGSKYTSNKTRYSPTDPDTRISVKPGKARRLNYLCNIAVDTAAHVITDIQAYHADQKDTKYLQDTAYMKGKRQSTVEPVFGTLKKFLGLRKLNTIGIRQTNKCMHLAAIAYNLEKYLKSTTTKVKAGANALQKSHSSSFSSINSELLAFEAVLRVLISGFEFPGPKTRLA